MAVKKGSGFADFPQPASLLSARVSVSTAPEKDAGKMPALQNEIARGIAQNSPAHLGTVTREWKAPVSLRVPQALRAELEVFAARERRTLANLGEVLLGWAFEQLQTAGSVTALVKYRLGKRKGTAK